jgi:hypothetical protein
MYIVMSIVIAIIFTLIIEKIKTTIKVEYAKKFGKWLLERQSDNGNYTIDELYERFCDRL